MTKKESKLAKLEQKLDNIDNLSNITIQFVRNKIKNAKIKFTNTPPIIINKR